MAGKIRKQVYLEAEQDRLLKRLSKKTGMTEAELIRRAINGQMGSVTLSYGGHEVWKQEVIYIRRLMRKGSVAGKRTWQREDLHER